MASGKNKRLFTVFFIILSTMAILTAITAFFFRDKYYPPILMYHNIEKMPQGNDLFVTPAQFEEQMRFLRDRGYNIVPLSELADDILSGKPVPRNTVVVTFDDGNENNYINAFPILKKYRIPATVFMVSDYIGRGGYLGISQIRRMSEAGIEFGSHTRSHCNLKDVPAQLVESEVLHSKKVLEAVTGKEVETFCYPSGEKSSFGARILKESGFKCAVVTLPRDGSIEIDPYALKRIKIATSRVNIIEFAAKASGYYTWFKVNKWKKKK